MAELHHLNERKVPSLINSERYCEIIQQFIAMLEPSERYSWFQRDNATAHTSQATTNLLKEFFDERLIFQGLWPP